MPDNRLRSQVDVGVPKVRRRGSLQPYFISGRMTLDEDQRADLLTFVSATTGGGVLPFNFPDPFAGDDLLVQFGNELPQISDVRGLNYFYQITLEVLP
jgi:hypothetical protein|tara:strand:- start:6592 stop:6885 length:294 start_codon:yes stop_codon:yes gene_type:complete